jgi:hypothetical protein
MGAVVFAVIFAVMTVNYMREPNLIPTPAGLGGPENSRPGTAGASRSTPPELADERKVTEQDCSKPVDFSSGNLRCK